MTPLSTNSAGRVAQYLRRIGYDGPTDGSAAALAALQQAHLCTVPYENFDILRGQPLSLNPDALFEKIVTHRRGGYCFELNGLFGWLLKALGYPVTEYFARFLKDERRKILMNPAPATSVFSTQGESGSASRRRVAISRGFARSARASCSARLQE